MTLRTAGILATGIGMILLTLALGAGVSHSDAVVALDLAWMAGMLEVRSPILDVPAYVLNRIGAGVLGAVIIPALVVVVLLLWRRRWAALLFGIAALIDPFVVGFLKALFGRARPPELLFDVDSAAYPSGHASRAALIAVTLAIVFHKAWVYAAGALYTVAMMLSRNYLGVHWLSDVVGGAALGAAIAIMLFLPIRSRLRAETEASHPPPWRPKVAPN